MVVAVGGTVMSIRLQGALEDLNVANKDKTDKLWQAYLERARALRSSGHVGQRFETLKVIGEAAKIKITPELRDEAVAALVLPDVEIAREWEGYPQGSLNVDADTTLQRYVRMSSHGDLTVCRSTSAGEEVSARLPAHGQPFFRGLWMSPDGRSFAYSHSSRSERSSGDVRIWRLDGPVPTVYADAKDVRDFVVAFSADGRRLALGHVDGTISLYDLDRAALPGVLRIGEPANGLAFHPRDGRLAVACSKSIRLFDVNSDEELPALQNPKVSGWANGLAWHPGGRLLAATAGHGIHLWDTEAAAEALPPLLGHTGQGIFVAFNREGDRLVSTGWDQQTRLWDPLTGRLLLTMPVACGTRFSADGTLFGLGSDGSKLQLWRVAEGRELRLLRRLTKDTTHPVLDAEGRILATTSEESLTFFDLATGRELASVELTGNHPRSFDPHEGWMTGGSAGTLLWPLTRDPMRSNVLRVGPPKPVSTRAHSGAAASTDGRVRVIPFGNEAIVLDRTDPAKRVVLGPLYDVRNVAVSPDGRFAATFSWWWDARYKSVRIWEADTGRHVVRFARRKGRAWRLQP